MWLGECSSRVGIDSCQSRCLCDSLFFCGPNISLRRSDGQVNLLESSWYQVASDSVYMDTITPPHTVSASVCWAREVDKVTRTPLQARQAEHLGEEALIVGGAMGE
jgi:hypothetical protein